MNLVSREEKRRDIKKKIWIEDRYLVVIASALFWGFFAHGYAFANKFSYRDDIHMQDGVGATFSSGRWALGILDKLVDFLFGVFSIPWVNGAVSVFFLALTCMMLVRLFDIKSKTICFLTTGLIVTFPAMTVLFSLMFTSTYYAFAIMLTILAVYVCEFMHNKVFGSVLSVLFIAFSLGIYQAYIGFAVCGFLILYFLKLIDDKKETLKEQLLRALWYAGILAGGLAAYMGVNKLCLKILNLELTDYQGIGTMYEITVKQVFRRIITAYANFFLNRDCTTVHTNVFMEKSIYIFYASIIGLLCLGVILVIRTIRDKKYKEAVLMMLVAAVFPLAVNIVYIMGAAYMYQLMLHVKVMVFVLLLVLIDRVTIQANRNAVFRLACVAGIFYLCLYYSIYANRCYQQAQVAQSRTIAWMTTLETQIKEQDGFRDSMKIAYINNPCDGDLTFVVDSEFSNVELMGFTLDLRFYNSWRDFMQFWTGFHMDEVDEAKYEELKRSDMIIEMPSYPSDGSIEIVDDVVIVKF